MNTSNSINTNDLDLRWKQIRLNFFPWGVLFAKRDNFESGFFQKEGEFVKKYLKPRSKILVLGSGNGREARPIAREGHKIVCMDLGLGYLVAGNKLFSSENEKDVHFVQAEVLSLPFTAGSFDFVFFSFYSSCKEDRFAALDEVRRVLRPGGLVLLSTVTPLYHCNSKTKNWAIFHDDQAFFREVSAQGLEVLDCSIDPLRQ